jgi:hypothetical protein
LFGRSLIFIAEHETGAFGIMQDQNAFALMISPSSIIASASSSAGFRISISSPSSSSPPFLPRRK